MAIYNQILRIWIATLASLVRNDEVGVDSANRRISHENFTKSQNLRIKLPLAFANLTIMKLA
ncbi:hypothetical protein [Helicobacter sp. 23-1045]